MPSTYFDTSALAKWYVNESRSQDVEEYVRSVYPVYISLLTKIEMRSLAARRAREGHIDLFTQGKVIATFEGDLAGGHLVLLPHTIESFLVAESLLGSLSEIPLRTSGRGAGNGVRDLLLGQRSRQMLLSAPE